jgi:hypothetical protein
MSFININIGMFPMISVIPFDLYTIAPDVKMIMIDIYTCANISTLENLEVPGL